MLINVNPSLIDQLHSIRHRADALHRQTKSVGIGWQDEAELAQLEDDFLRLMQVEQARLQGSHLAARRN